MDDPDVVLLGRSFRGRGFAPAAAAAAPGGLIRRLLLVLAPLLAVPVDGDGLMEGVAVVLAALAVAAAVCLSN